MEQLKQDPRFADLAPKESWSETVPFRKMLVKVKNEIIRMDHPAIRPAHGRAPSVSPATLRRWLEQGHDDEGREVVTLDTRNDYEVDEGAFAGTIDWRLSKFTEFPPALRQQPQAPPHHLRAYRGGWPSMSSSSFVGVNRNATKIATAVRFEPVETSGSKPPGRVRHPSKDQDGRLADTSLFRHASEGWHLSVLVRTQKKVRSQPSLG